MDIKLGQCFDLIKCIISFLPFSEYETLSLICREWYSLLHVSTKKGPDAHFVSELWKRWFKPQLEYKAVHRKNGKGRNVFKHYNPRQSFFSRDSMREATIKTTVDRIAHGDVQIKPDRYQWMIEALLRGKQIGYTQVCLSSKIKKKMLDLLVANDLKFKTTSAFKFLVLEFDFPYSNSNFETFDEYVFWVHHLGTHTVVKTISEKNQSIFFEDIIKLFRGIYRAKECILYGEYLKGAETLLPLLEAFWYMQDQKIFTTVDTRSDQWFAFFCRGSVKLLSFFEGKGLLKHGINNYDHSWNFTPLYTLVNGYINNSVDIRRTTYKDILECVKILVENGADPYIRMPYSKMSTWELIEKNRDIDQVTQKIYSYMYNTVHEID